jgi:hypothetical protein
MFRRNDKSLGRRTFLRAFGSASTAAVVVATVPIAAIEEAQAYEPGDQETKARYRADSPDVEAFYRTNGYETLKK